MSGTLTADEARAVVLKALAEVAPEMDPDTLDPAADLAEELDIDSMDHLNMITAVCESTGIDIPERDYPKLTTLDGAVAYLTAAG
jgi:acyl carrier protein